MPLENVIEFLQANWGNLVERQAGFPDRNKIVTLFAGAA